MKDKKIRLVEIEWVDSSFISKDGNKWDWLETQIKEMREDGLEKMKSVGYLLDKTKDYILICGSLHFNLKGNAERGADFFTIPIGCVKKVKKVFSK